MQKNPEANEQVYSFYNDKVIVTKNGNIATAVFTGCPISTFKDANNILIPTTFVDTYPELIPKKAPLSCGLMWKAQADNYVAFIEVTAAGKVAITYKNTISGRANSIASDDYSIYGTISWITN